MMLVWMFVWMFVMVVFMLMVMVVRVRMGVMMVMVMRMRMGVMMLQLFGVSNTMQRDVDIHGMNAGNQSWFGVNLPTFDRQGRQAFAQNIEWHAAIEQSAQCHVAGNARKAIKIKNHNF